MSPQVMVVGAGQLGSRYLQGLVEVSTPLRVIAIEPSAVARETAVSRWADAGGGASHHELLVRGDLDDVSGVIDLAIVCTTAATRLDVVRRLAGAAQVMSWVLEKLVTNDADQLPEFEATTRDARSVWVNLPYRMMRWHRAIKQQLHDRGPCAFVLDGENYGLVTNAIHYLDVVGWWMDSSIESVSFVPDEHGFFEAKRPGYVEAHGTFEAHYSDGSYATMSCRGTPGPATGLTFDITGPDGRWQIDESSGVMRDSFGSKTRGRLELQSEMTGRLVSSILAGSGCDLPTLSETVRLHDLLLRSVQRAWAAQPVDGREVVPVT